MPRKIQKQAWALAPEGIPEQAIKNYSANQIPAEQI
jgi:hypothetical protein